MNWERITSMLNSKLGGKLREKLWGKLESIISGVDLGGGWPNKTETIKKKLTTITRQQRDNNYIHQEARD